ncbi:MAG TPA: septal ring lytic transglycosylase RlpA family protein [Thermoanaerobaculia bacterium]|jgi:rare lipoprotein A (peptidoglycan hydrolase)
MSRKGPAIRSISASPEKSRSRGAGFVWVAGVALTIYLGTAVASGNRDRVWENLSLPEDGAATDSSFRTLGRASWYGPRFDGSPTASGETFDMNALTAAHRTLPLGSRVLVHNLDNDHRVVVKINDRGPYVQGRDIDLSYGAARQLGMVPDGIARVEITPL